MKIKNAIVLVFTVCSLSCSSKESRNSQTVKESEKISATSLINSGRTIIDTPLITDDAFIMRVLSNDLTLSSVLTVYHPISQSTSLSVNMHNQSINDTLVTLTKGTDTLIFIKASGRVLAARANIETSTLVIDNGIQIGVAKSMLQQKFNVPQIQDLLVVSDLEGGNTFTFSFDISGNLVKITYQMLL